MKKLLGIALCLTLGFAVTGCNTATETPVVDVDVEEGEVVEVVLPVEVTEAIEAKMEMEREAEEGGAVDMDEIEMEDEVIEEVVAE